MTGGLLERDDVVGRGLTAWARHGSGFTRFFEDQIAWLAVRTVTCFVDDACVPLDNNATERGIRGPVVGRCDHFGSKSRRGT